MTEVHDSGQHFGKYDFKDQSWVFIGTTDVEAETPILWPPDGNN